MRCLPLGPALLLPMSVLVACSGTGTEPNTGIVKVHVLASGSPPDPDGFNLSMTGLVGNDPNAPILSQFFKSEGETQTFTGIPAGQHGVELQGVAENCAVTPSAYQTVQVIADETVDIAFTVTCSGG